MMTYAQKESKPDGFSNQSSLCDEGTREESRTALFADTTTDSCRDSKNAAAFCRRTLFFSSLISDDIREEEVFQTLSAKSLIKCSILLILSKETRHFVPLTYLLKRKDIKPLRGWKQ